MIVLTSKLELTQIFYNVSLSITCDKGYGTTPKNNGDNEHGDI